MIPGRVIEYRGSSPGNCDLHVTNKVIYILVCSIVRQVMLYMHERSSVQIYENFFKMKKEINTKYKRAGGAHPKP